MKIVLATACFVGLFGVLALLLSPSATPRSGPILVTATLIKASTHPLGAFGRAADVSEQKFQVNDRNGRPVGRWLLACRWVTFRNRLCLAELKMPLGKITAAGSSFTPLSGQYAITGGTELYDNASGVMTFTSIGRGKLILSFTLT